jgi:hypothetical protein
MKQGWIALLAVAALLGFFALSPRVSHLTDCRNYARNPGVVSALNFVKEACPNPGPYGDNNSVILYALLSPFAGSSGPTINANAAGNWAIASIGGPVPLCRLTQSGSDLSGSCDGPGGLGPVTGSVNGQSISWTWEWTSKANGFEHNRWMFDGRKNSDGNIVGNTRSANGISVDFIARPAVDVPATESAALPDTMPGPVAGDSSQVAYAPAMPQRPCNAACQLGVRMRLGLERLGARLTHRQQ